MRSAIIVTTNEKDGIELKSNLECEKIVEVIDIFSNANIAYDFVKAHNVDMVITDIVLQSSDGFELLEKLKQLEVAPKVIVLTAVSGDAFVQKALSLGASYYMMKPYNIKVLKTRIEEVFNEEKNVLNNKGEIINMNNSVKSLDGRLSNIFITVGIPAHIKGYQFLREAIKMAIETPDIINSITKKLYPSIAEKFDTSSSKVERAIRHAIEVAWNRGKIENINSLFGVKVYSDNEKPTNGEFIALVADKMLIEGA